jgi:hypothetical protein
MISAPQPGCKPRHAAKIIRIFAQIWAAGRYRFGRVAAVVVALYLAVVAVAAVLAVSGDLSALSVAATAMTWTMFAEGGDWLGPLFAGICGFNAWVLWQMLRGPALPRAEGLPRNVVWLRRLLYAGVVGDLVLWELVEELSDTVAYVASLVAWTATVILLVRVVSGVSARFRAIALALGLIGVLTSPSLFFLDGPGLQAISLLGLASFGWTVMILVGQRRDGRWSDATINIGRIALVTPLAFPLLNLAFQNERLLFSGPGLVVNALGVFTTLWLVRTAHELARPADMPAAETATRPATGRAPRRPSPDGAVRDRRRPARAGHGHRPGHGTPPGPRRRGAPAAPPDHGGSQPSEVSGSEARFDPLGSHGDPVSQRVLPR